MRDLRNSTEFYYKIMQNFEVSQNGVLRHQNINGYNYSRRCCTTEPEFCIHSITQTTSKVKFRHEGN